MNTCSSLFLLLFDRENTRDLWNFPCGHGQVIKDIEQIMYFLLFSDVSLDVFWGQPIKLIQVVSTSEFHEYCWNNIDFNVLVPAS